MKFVHESALKHGLTEEEVLLIHENIFKETLKKGTTDTYLAISDYKNITFEVIYKTDHYDNYLIYHCMRATKKFLRDVLTKY